MKLFVVLVFFLATVLCSCGANEGVLRSGKETPELANVEGTRTTLAKDLESMHTAGFTFVYVLRRKDGGNLDAEDRSVIKLQTAEANRRVAADDGRAFVVGSNVQIPAKNMTALYDRFVIEDHAPSTVDHLPPPAVANTNAKISK